MNYVREEFERLNEKVRDKEIEKKDIEHLITILAYSKKLPG
jgi:hypothetical protein